MATKKESNPIPYSTRLKIIRERLARARRAERFTDIPMPAKVKAAQKTLAEWETRNEAARDAHEARAAHAHGPHGDHRPHGAHRPEGGAPGDVSLGRAALQGLVPPPRAHDARVVDGDVPLEALLVFAHADPPKLSRSDARNPSVNTPSTRME